MDLAQTKLYLIDKAKGSPRPRVVANGWLAGWLAGWKLNSIYRFSSPRISAAI
jgi:hypothetical protein